MTAVSISTLIELVLTVFVTTKLTNTLDKHRLNVHKHTYITECIDPM